MTFEEYLETGGDREEKLVAIYKTHPERLSDEYRSLFTVMESENTHMRKYLASNDLLAALQNWDRIKKDLARQGADFV